LVKTPTSAVRIERDADYSELVTIDHLPDLMMAIGFSLVAKPERLTGADMRFLRKRTGATQNELGAELWVSEQTIANYEKGRTDAGAADRAVRFLFFAPVADDGGIADELRLEAEELMRPSQRDRRTRRAGLWLVAA
jgi:DNA-binding transcriptional regulator YiaG